MAQIIQLTNSALDLSDSAGIHEAWLFLERVCDLVASLSGSCKIFWSLTSSKELIVSMARLDCLASALDRGKSDGLIDWKGRSDYEYKGMGNE